MTRKLSATLLELILVAIPSYSAAEVLLFLVARRERVFSAEEIVVEMRPLSLTTSAVEKYLEMFVMRGLLREQEGRVRYGPESPELDRQVGELVRAYNEQPVTLIRAIYRTPDSGIQAFADAFRLRKGR